MAQDLVEAHLSILEEIVEDEMATKADIQNLDVKVDTLESKMATKADIQNLDMKISSLESKFDLRFQAMGSRMEHMEYKLTIKMGLMIAAAVGILATLIKVG